MTTSRLFLCALSFTFGLALTSTAQQPVAKPYSEGVKVTQLMKTTTTGAGQPIVYATSDSPEVTAVMVEIPAGKQTGWHKHPVACYGYVAAGKISVELEDGTVHEYAAGQAIAEAVNILHNGTNKGTESCKIILFALSSKGVPFSVVTPAPR
ncbi:cupin domain-containing protein [Oleiharenicola lentus]|uniref:cupin domain-containing protein n=1 Tax=Oleiharenicola lentus TaxID=2508720 RepID=UPI003F674B84